MKKIFVALFVLVLLLGLGAYFLLGNLDQFVESTLEEVGTELTGTDVEVDQVAIDLASGSVTLEGLQIDNPAGYTSDYALRLKRVTVAVDPATFAMSVITIDQVMVRGARVNVEQKAERTNLSDLLEQVQSNSDSTDSGVEETTPSDVQTDVRFFLKRFVFANTKATLTSDQSGKQVITVPDVKRNNIGNKKQGLTPEQLGDALLNAVLEEIEAAVAEHLAAMATEAVKDKILEKIGLPTEG